MPKFDRYGNPSMGLTQRHFLIHTGKCFSLVLPYSNIGAAAANYISIEVPATIEFHLWGVGLSAFGGVSVSLFEAPTSFTGGTAKVPWNKSRLGTRTAPASLLTIKDGVTPTLGSAVEMYLGRSFRDAVQLDASDHVMLGVDGPDDEIVLKPGTTYLVKTLTDAGTGNYFDVEIAGYERPIKVTP